MSEGDRTSSNAVPLDAARRVATLARLALSEEQLARHATTLSDVLDHFGALRGVDLTGVEPMSHPADADSPLGADEPGPTLATDAVLRRAPDAAPPFFRVPKVLGEGGGGA